MSETYTRSALASHVDEVTELMDKGYAFGHVEEAIDRAADLTEDAKAALWLLAFSLRAPSDQVRDARAHVAALA
jgi:hypothetical protein